MINNKNKSAIGSSFDDFLVEEGILAECESSAIKKVIAYQLEQTMRESHISKSALAKMMKTSRSSLDRVLDPSNDAISLKLLENAVLAMGKRLELQIV